MAENVPRSPRPDIGDANENGGFIQKVQFKLEFQQSSLSELAKEIRKVALLSSGITGSLGWLEDAGLVSIVYAAGIWLLVQVCAIIIDTVRVYAVPDEKNGAQPSSTTAAEGESQ